MDKLDIMNTPTNEITANKTREIVISAKNIKKTFYVKESPVDSIRNSIFSFSRKNNIRAIPALKGVDFEVYKGEIFGVIGRNGSGKSTLLKIISGAYPADKDGELSVQGKLIRLALGMGFDGNLSARENIYLNGSILGLSFKQIGQKFQEIIDFAELQDFVETKVKFYSSGMNSRLAFAIAIHAEADIFLMDEFFGGVGDVRFQEKSAKVFKEAFLNGRTILHVSHDLNSIRAHCNRVLLLNNGEMLALGTPDEVIPIYEGLFK